MLIWATQMLVNHTRSYSQTCPTALFLADVADDGWMIGRHVERLFFCAFFFHALLKMQLDITCLSKDSLLPFVPHDGACYRVSKYFSPRNWPL